MNTHELGQWTWTLKNLYLMTYPFGLPSLTVVATVYYLFRLIYSRDTEAMKIALMIFDRKCEENDKFVKVHPTLTLNNIFLVTQTIWVYASRIWLKRFNFDLKIFHHNILPDHENQNIQNIYLTVLILQGRTFSTAAGWSIECFEWLILNNIRLISL